MAGRINIKRDIKKSRKHFFFLMHLSLSSESNSLRLCNSEISVGSSMKLMKLEEFVFGSSQSANVVMDFLKYQMVEILK